MTPEQIEALLSRLNFEKIHQYMVAVNWGYGFENQVPSIDTLRETAREVLQQVATCDRPNSMCSTGGFLACKWTWDESMEYEINFVIEDASDIRRK
jgi:hypothetical protein